MRKCLKCDNDLEPTRVQLCVGCARKWSVFKAYWWEMFLDPPMDRPPRGLSSAKQILREEADAHRVS